MADDRAALLAEAYRRGILPPDMKTAYEEAQKRGIVTAPKTGTMESVGEGYLAGASANFRDEIYGASEASGLPHWLGGFRAPVGAARLAYEGMTEPGAATAAYTKGRDEIRERQKTMQAEHPTAYGAGELGGAVAGTALAPGGRAATMGARMGEAALTGAGYGALSGAGAGEDATGRALGAGVGAVTGGAGAAAAVPVGAALRKGVETVASPIVSTVRGWVNPEGEAAGRVVGGLMRDKPQIDSGKALGMTPKQFAAAKQAGEPVMLADLGSATTKATMRSAANTSPEARDVIESAVGERFKGQNVRASASVRDLVAGKADAYRSRQKLEAQYDAERGKAYAAAYSDGDRPINSPKLQQLMSSRAVQSAMRDAAERGNDRAVAEGHGGFNSPIEITPDGRMKWRTGKGGIPTYPNLQFWDYTKRGIDDMASAAVGARRNDEGRVLALTAQQLRDELDNLVPKYADARGVATKFFGGEKASEAGAKAVNFAGDVRELQDQLRKMKPAELELFREGHADALANKLSATSDRVNITGKLFESPQARARIEAIHGPTGTKALEALIWRENIFHAAKEALGNSTTARQLIESGLAGGAAGAYFGNRESSPIAGAFAGAGAGLVAGKTGAYQIGKTAGQHLIGYVDKDVAKRVAELLTSNDPKKLMAGVEMVAHDAKIMDGLRAVGDKLSRGVGSGAGAPRRPLQITVPPNRALSPGGSDPLGTGAGP